MKYRMSPSSYRFRFKNQDVLFRFRNDVINESLGKFSTPYAQESNLTDNCQVFLKSKRVHRTRLDEVHRPDEILSLKRIRPSVGCDAQFRTLLSLFLGQRAVCIFVQNTGQ